MWHVFDWAKLFISNFTHASGVHVKFERQVADGNECLNFEINNFCPIKNMAHYYRAERVYSYSYI